MTRPRVPSFCCKIHFSVHTKKQSTELGKFVESSHFTIERALNLRVPNDLMRMFPSETEIFSLVAQERKSLVAKESQIVFSFLFCFQLSCYRVRSVGSHQLGTPNPISG